ncbi:hypothetical protein [uncultured Eubacterium sp.]|uniref:alginate O-acetyltransferase AlgX-related protein n=1 Tax=uncultured Eubacterium sp. TaxID=165185 RepID=UPI0032634A39
MINLIKKVFILVFMVIIFVPLLFTNQKEDTVSEAENRVLSNKPNLYIDNKLNGHFLADFDEWIQDNIGFRENIIKLDAQIQYHLFRQFSDKNYKLNETGELNYIGQQVLANYQHLNLYSEEELAQIISAFKDVNNYLNNKNIQFYYMQCWDKQSIYPEYFPKSVNQYGSNSACDQVIKALNEKTDVYNINLKEALITSKDDYEVYSKWGDPTHWTPRGAHVGYLQLMNSINKNSNIQYRVLQEADYTHVTKDIGQTLSGTIHFRNPSEILSLRNDTSEYTNEKFTIDAGDPRSTFLTNKTCDNNTRILIIGDSYIHSYILKDISQSFYETILLWKWSMPDLKNLVEEYQPDIIVYEQAEREKSFSDIIDAAESLKSN